MLLYVKLSHSIPSTLHQTYVQHLLKKNADAIIHQLMEERGHFYVCGDISMAADVSRTLQVPKRAGLRSILADISSAAIPSVQPEHL